MSVVVRTREIRRIGAVVVLMVTVALLYFVAGRAGLTLQVPVEGAVVTPLWPPTGIALAALLWFGLRIWPGIALGIVLTILAVGPLGPSAFGVLAGNCLAPVLAYLMLRRVGFRNELDRLKDGLALVFLGAIAGMMVSATVGTGVLTLAGQISRSDFWPVWSAWWVGDAMGVLVITPLLLVARNARRPTRVRPGRWIEAVLLLGGTFVVALLTTRADVPMFFLVFPLLIWAALRFQLAGAAPCVLIESVMAIWAATDGVGPFAGHSLLAVMGTLQALNASAALTGLLLSAIVTEQTTIRRKLEQACVELADVVDQLSPGAGARWPPREGKR